MLKFISVSIVIVFVFGAFRPHRRSESDMSGICLRLLKESNDTSKKRIRNYGFRDNNPLFVFVGKKISVEKLPYEKGSMDEGFIAKYQILQRVYGHFRADTIEFFAYDHYGTPGFSKFQHVLLFVSADSGYYYHQKYMYNDIYRTKSGRWAGAYAMSDYRHSENEDTKIKPVRIDFLKPVYYPTKFTSPDGKTYTIDYPEPYFKKVGDSAMVIYGNYVRELFLLKKNGYLTARGLF